MKKIAIFLISKIKREPYNIDSKIPDLYLINLSLKRLLMVLRGWLAFIKHDGLFFLGSGVTIKARTLIKTGSGVTIDDNCYIDALSENGIIVGNNVMIGKRTVIECTGNLKLLGKGLKIGNNVGLTRDLFIGCAGGVEIGNDTLIGNYVSIHSENHNYSENENLIRLQGVNHKGISIGNNCWIGAKAIILDGVTIEDGCVFAAGSVVWQGHYKENGVYGGNPARLIKSRISPAT